REEVRQVRVDLRLEAAGEGGEAARRFHREDSGEKRVLPHVRRRWLARNRSWQRSGREGRYMESSRHHVRREGGARRWEDDSPERSPAGRPGYLPASRGAGDHERVRPRAEGEV